jgi:ACS family hexuronate transporter-like MFS transporter
MAVFSNGNVLGSIIAPPLTAFLLMQFGWRSVFLITGALGFVLLAVWRRAYYAPKDHPGLTDEERAVVAGDAAAEASPAATKPIGVFALLREPACAGFFVARLLTDPITYFFMFWLFSYLKEERRFSMAMIGAVGWLPFLASDIGGPGGGALSDWLIRRGWCSRRARLALMLFAASMMPVAIVAVLTPSPWLSIACIAVILGSQSCWMANQLTLISESVPRTHVASLLALSALGGSIGGIIANLTAGRVIAAVGYVPVFCTLGFCHLTAFAVLSFTSRRRSST